MEMCVDEHVAQTPLHLDPVRCAHTGKEQCCMNGALWSAHEKNVRLRAYRLVWCLHLPSHSRLLLLAECETQIQDFFKKIKLIRTRRGMRSDLLVVGDNVELLVLSRVAPVAWMLMRLLWKREFEVVSLTSVLTIHRPVNCTGVIFASSKSMKMNSTMMSSVTSWMRRMAADVLLRCVLPNLDSATQGTLAVKDRSCYVSFSFHVLGQQEPVVLFSPCVDVSIAL